MTQQLTLFDPETQQDFPKLRDYQMQVREDLFDALKAGFKRVMVYAATGAGKTIIAGRIVYDAAVLKNRKVLFVVHRDILIKQTLECFSRFGLECGVIAGNYPENRIKTIQIASIQTMSRRDWQLWFQPDIVIADECHITSWGAPVMAIKPKLAPGEGLRGSCSLEHLKPYLQQLGIEPPCTLHEVKVAYKDLALKNHPDLNSGDPEATAKMQAINASWDKIQGYAHLFNKGDDKSSSKSPANNEIPGIYIGLTATPWRMSKREEMGDIFEKLVSAPMPSELIEKGYLVKPVYYGIPKADISNVRISDGDFNQSDLAIVCNNAEIIEAAVQEWKRLALGRLTIVFAVGVNHAKAIADAFNNAAIPAASVDGSMPVSDCDRIYKQLAAGEILVLVSCEKLGEGFDVPAVSCIILSRPTKSKAKYFQQLGRGLRIAEGKQDCIVIDQAGNVNRFGFVEDIKQVTLKRSSDDEAKEAPVKECPKCGALIYTFLMICPHCGHEFPRKGDELSEIKRLELLLPKADKERFRWYRSAIKRAFFNRSKKRTPIEVSGMFIKNFQSGLPPAAWRLHAVFGEEPTQQNLEDYTNYLQACAYSCNIPWNSTAKWVKSQLVLEFGREFVEQTRELITSNSLR